MRQGSPESPDKRQTDIMSQICRKGTTGASELAASNFLNDHNLAFLGGHKMGSIANVIRQLKKLLARALLDGVEHLVNDHNLALSWRPQEEQHSHTSKVSAGAAVMALVPAVRT